MAPDRSQRHRGSGGRTILGAPASLVALAATAFALFPGRPAGLAAFGLALSGLLLLPLVERRRALRRRLATGLVLAGLVAITAPELSPVPDPSRLLPAATARVEHNWRSFIDALDRAVRDPPLAGGDYGWLETRRRALGDGAGIAVLAPDATVAHEWAGWTSPLNETEREALLRELAHPPAVLVLRRGLALRLLVARRAGEPEDALVVAAERRLPPEPMAGELAAGTPRGVAVRVRWQSIGEGVRATLGTADTAGPPVAFWSLLPLMANGKERAGLASLGIPPAALLEKARGEARRVRAAWLGAAALLLLALGARARFALLLLPCARLLLLATEGERIAEAAGPADLLAGTPERAAATGLMLVGFALLVPLPRGAVPRRTAALAGLALAAVGLAWARHLALAGPPPTGSAFWPAVSALLGLDWIEALGAGTLAWAGLALAARAAGLRPAVAFAAAGLAAGLAAGGVQAASLTAAAQRRTERGLARELAERNAIWERALRETLALAVPPPEAEVLAQDRDAIDLWWRSALGRSGLVSGVWRFRPGEPEMPADAFVSGLPPVTPRARLVGNVPDPAGPFPRRVDGPRRVRLPLLSGSVELLTLEALRPDGGSWIAGILVEPGNLPGRRHDDPLLRARGGAGGARPVLPFPVLEPQLTWFDDDGTQLGSEPAVGPPPPRAPPTTARWRRTRLSERPALLYEMPDEAGTITAVLILPGRLTLAAIAVGWGLWFLACAVAVLALGSLAVTTPHAVRRAARLARRLAGEFRAQLAISLIAAGLLPLLVLGTAGRTASRRQAERQLTAEGARAAQVGRRLLEDFLAVEGDAAWRSTEPDARDAVATWIASELGEDLFAWERGELVATSRPDLVRAGLWPERLPGHVQRAIAVGRVPLLLESATPSGPLVAHGPYRVPAGDASGILSIPLRGAVRRLAAEVVGVDRALIVSSALLVLLAGALLVPATRRLVRPLAELERATSQIAGGRFDVPVPETGYAETRALARALRAMADSLDRQRRSLERRREAMEALIESMPVAVVALSAGGIVWAANSRARDLLAVETGRPLPRGPSTLGRVAVELASGGAARSERVSLAGPAGPAVYRVAGLDLPGPAGPGDPARLLLIEDLTDAVRSERLVAWAEMARRIAHEIKNPLTPISLLVDHVRRLRERNDPKLAEALDRFLDTIAEQVAVLKETSREFSDYARLLVARPEPIALPERLAEWLAPYRLAPPSGVRFELGGPDDLPQVEADPRLLRRAVVNLVDNAIAAVAEGGSVRVAWSSDRTGIRISVEDDGPGIPPERLQAILEPDVTTRSEGTGLGLAIVREAVEAHGGRLEIDTAPGRGARFTIVLPAGPKRAESAT